MPEKHYRISPSSLHRVFNCPGSLRLSEQYESRSSSYADEGTLAHDLAAQLLRGREVLAETAEMQGHIEGYAAFVDSQDGDLECS